MDYEEQVIEHIIKLVECSRGDAQGILEAWQKQRLDGVLIGMDQAGHSPEKVANHIYVESGRKSFGEMSEEEMESMCDVADPLELMQIIADLEKQIKQCNDDKERLVDLASHRGIAYRDDCPDSIYESWRALPDHLQELINAKEKEIDKQNG